MEPCSLGNILQDALCHKTTYSRKAEINDFKCLSADEQSLLLWRVQVKDQAEAVKTKCLHHQ